MNYKKLIAALLAIALVFCLGACQNKTDSTDKETGKDSAQDTKPAEPTEPTEPKQEEKPPVYADMTPAEALKTAQKKLAAADSFAFDGSLSAGYGESTDAITEESTEKYTFNSQVQKNAQGSYDMYGAEGEGRSYIYMSGNTRWTKSYDRIRCEVEDADFTLNEVLEVALDDTILPAGTLERFAQENPKRTEHSDGSVTYSLDDMSVPQWDWVVLGEESTEESLGDYKMNDSWIKFHIDADGMLSGWEVRYEWSSATNKEASIVTMAVAVEKVGENLNLQKPDWAVAE